MGKNEVARYSPAKLGREYQLSPNITLGEMMSKGTDGSEPTPVDTELIAKIQQMRDLLSEPVHINSGYRTVKHNSSVGGAAGSYHTLGRAADIWFGKTFETRVSDKVAAQCAQYVGFKGIGLYPGRIHVDTRETPYYYEKLGNAYIPVSGFPGYQPKTATVEPEISPEPTPVDVVPILLTCRCGAPLPAVEGFAIDGTVYAPVRAICETLGYKVDWDGSKVTVG